MCVNHSSRFDFHGIEVKYKTSIKHHYRKDIKIKKTEEQY
jgi:hypothetical protein